MLTVFFGNDAIMVRTQALMKARELAGSGGYTLLSPENMTADVLNGAIGVASLFSAGEVFILDTISLDDALFEILLLRAPELKASANQFVLIEGSLLPAYKKVFSMHADVCTEFKKAKREWNAFALSDALLMRDKKTLWLLLQEGWREGYTSEAMVGTLHWQLKILRIAACTKTAEEAGQKPFVYEKAKRALTRFKKGELTQLNHDLIVRYHEGHMGKRNIDTALEEWVLTL
jgi:hypothetical protein